MANRRLLLVEQNPDFENIYSINFNAYLGMDVHCVHSSEEAIAQIENDEATLIVARAQLGQDKTAEKLYHYITKNNIQSPLITLGDFEQAIGDSTIVSSGVGLKTLIQTSAKKLNITAKDMVSLEVPPYYPFDISLFEKMEYSPFRVYHQNMSGEYENLNLTEEYDNKKIESLMQKNVSCLYVDANERLKMTELITEHLVSGMDINNLNDQEKIDQTEQSMHLLSGKLVNVGVTKNSAILAAAALKGTINNAKTKKGLRSLLKKLLENKHSYAYLHTQLLTFFGIQLMQVLDWGNLDQMKKFSFVSLFHDILLMDDKLARIHTKEELAQADLTPELKEFVETHAQRTSELVMKFPNTPLTCEVIIRQHHGTLNGQGFLSHASGNLTQLATLFMVVEYFVELSLAAGAQVNFDEVIKNVAERYSTSRFKPIINALGKIINSK